MAATHIAEDEAIRDLPKLLARARAGEEIWIEGISSPSVILRSELSAQNSRAEPTADELGEDTVLDPDFAADVREVIGNRKPRRALEWE